MEKNIDLLYKSYEFFLAKRKGKAQWQCSHTDRVSKLLSNFLKLIEGDGITKDNIGINWLFKYTSFQFSRYKLEHKVPATKIFGKKAYDKWCSRKPYWAVYATRNMYSTLSITFQDFVTYCTDAKVTYIRDKGDEIHKEPDHNTDLGFLKCLEYTTLYNHKSKWCMTCKFQKHCKAVLKKTMPTIYKQRKYDK